MDDRRLAELAAKGDHDAFEQLVQRYQKQVYNLALRMTGDREEAYDLTQETFLRVWRGLDFFRNEASFSTWLYRLAANACTDYLRKLKRSATVSLVFLADDGETEWDVPDPAPGPETQVVRRENSAAIAAAFYALPVEYREVLALHAVSGLKYAEIADVLGLKIGTVKSRIARSRTMLRNSLAASGNIFAENSSDTVKGGEEA